MTSKVFSFNEFFSADLVTNTMPDFMCSSHFNCFFHIAATQGQIANKEFLFTTYVDLRRYFTENLIKTLKDFCSIVIANIPFEISRMKELAVGFLDLAAVGWLFNLLSIVGNHRYHISKYMGILSIRVRQGKEGFTPLIFPS